MLANFGDCGFLIQGPAYSLNPVRPRHIGYWSARCGRFLMLIDNNSHFQINTPKRRLSGTIPYQRVHIVYNGLASQVEEKPR